MTVIERLRAFDDGKLRKSTRVFVVGKKPKNKAREMPFQVKLVVALRRRLPEGSLVWHTFNRRKDKKEAIFAKQMGAVAGIPDLFVLLPFDRRRETQLLAIECKAPKGGVLSEAQEYVRAQLDALGVPFFLARDVDSALDWIAQFVPLKEKRDGA